MMKEEDFEKVNEKPVLEIGKLYYCEEIEIDKNCVFDENSNNFHLLPKIENDEDKEKWEKYFDQIQKLRTDIAKKLKELLEKTKWNEIEFDVSIRSNGICKKYTDIPKDYHFFRHIKVIEKSKSNSQCIRGYLLNFMRFYIENKKVNCILGEFQFDSVPYNKNGLNLKNINSKDNIAYPKTKFDQDLTDIKLNPRGACVYNPKNLGSIHDCNNEDVAKEFVDFINCIIKKEYENKQ